MELKLPPKTIEGRLVCKVELDRYIASSSIANLVLQLREVRREGVLNFEIILDRSYLSEINDRKSLALQAGVLRPLASFDLSYAYDKYGLGGLHGKIRTGEPLSESDIAFIIAKLPENIAAELFRYKLFNIDWEAYEKLVDAYPSNSRPEDDYIRVEHEGLVVDGTSVSFKGRQVRTSVQHRETIRLFVESAGALCFYDDFFEHSRGIFARSDYANPRATLRHLISDIRADLRGLTGRDCIASVAGEGYRLVL